MPWHQFGLNSSLGKIHFSPANGIPAASYDGFFQHFDGHFSISTMDSRGGWGDVSSPDESITFQDYADDLITFLESNYNQPVIGMGHSLGGMVTILAAIKRPELFSKLVLIDPASTPTPLADFIFKGLPAWLILKLLPFIRGSLERRRVWDSREQFFTNYRHHPTFKRFTDQALSDYAQHGLKLRNDGQYELIFKPEWEAFNFRKVRFLWHQLNKVEHNALFLRAEHESLYSETTFNRYNARLHKNVTAKTLPKTSHLMTHEKPDIVSAQIIKWLTT